MSEQRVVTTVSSVLAAAVVVSSVSPTVDAWLNWAMAWVLGVAVGGPLLVWAVRVACAEIALSIECRRAAPRVEPVEQVEVVGE